jgi:hypothetical protein
MRIAALLRSSLTFAAVCAVSASEAGAQKRTFQDSWFWGAKASGMMYSTRRTENAVAPGVGAEWLITRTHAALNLAVNQYFFDDFSAIDDPSNPAVGRTVKIQNMRNLGAQLWVFPRTFGYLRPYAGGGLNFNLISTATATGAFASQSQLDTVRTRLQEARTGVVPVFTAGAQSQFRGLNFFAQGSFSPAKTTFLFNRNNTYFFEGGIRYNVGSAIDRPQ